MKRLLSASLIAVLAMAAPACADILIGAAAPLSGPNATLGEQLRRGVQMAVDEINGTGGVNGERLGVSFADDGCDPRRAVEAATGFVSLGARAVIGHYCSGASIPASKVYEKAGIVQISPASTHPRYTDQGGWNVLRLCPRDDSQAQAAAELVLRHFPGGKVAVLSDEQPASRALAARFRDTLGAKGVKPAIDDSYRPGARNYAPLARRLADAGVSVVYLTGSYVESGLIARGLNELGARIQIIGSDALVTEDFWNLARDGGEGAIVSFTYDPRKFEQAASVVQRFREEDISAEGFTLYAYAAVQAWAAAAEATDVTDGARIAQWLRAGNRVPTVAGDIRFDAKGDLADPRIAWFRWSDGRYAEIDPATLQPPVLNTTP